MNITQRHVVFSIGRGVADQGKYKIKIKNKLFIILFSSFKSIKKKTVKNIFDRNYNNEK